MPYFKNFLVTILAIVLISPPAHSSEIPEKLETAILATKVNKYGSLNSLSAIRRLNGVLYGPVQVLDVAKTPKQIFRDRFLEPFPPMPSAPATVDERRGFLQAMAEGMDASNPVQVLPIIRNDDSFDRGLTTKEKRQLLFETQELILDYKEEDLSENEKELVEIVLTGYLNIDVKNGISDSDPDFFETALLLDKISVSSQEILDGQKNIVEQIASNGDRVIKQVSEGASKLISDSADHLANKIDTMKAAIDEDLESQKKLSDTAFKFNQEATRRIEQRLQFLQDRAITEDINKEIFSYSDPEKLDVLLTEVASCDATQDRCRILKTKSGTIWQRKTDLEFTLKLNITKNVSSTLSGLAQITGDQELLKVADTLDKVTMTIETVDKMNDLLSNALVSGGLAAMGDVTSMVSLGVTLVAAFGDSGPSPEQLILEQLVKIQEQIQELREEMHDRFDELDQKISELAITMDSQFENVNANLLIIADRQKTIEDLIANEVLTISKSRQIDREIEIRNKLEELRKRRNRIAGTFDFADLEDAFFDIVADFEAFVSLHSKIEIVWSDQQEQGEYAEQLQRIVFGPLQSGEISELNWLDLLSQLAKHAEVTLSNSACSGVNPKVFALFSLYSDSLANAFSEEFDDYISIDAKSPNKFSHFLLTAPIESEYFENLREPFAEYVRSIRVVERCLKDYSSRPDGTRIDFMQYLLSVYKSSLMNYLGELEQIFSEDGAMLSSFRNAVSDPKNEILSEFSKNFLELDPSKTDRRASLNFDQIERYQSYQELRDSMNSEAIIKSTYSGGIPECNGNAAPIEPPTSLILKNFPRHETWVSVLLGLNKVRICYSWASQIDDAGWLTHENVFSLRYVLSNYQDVFSGNPPYTFVQDFFISRTSIPGERYTREIIEEPQDGQFVKIIKRYIKPNKDKILSDFVSNGALLSQMPLCFDHKDFIFQCFPSNYETDYMYYLPDVSHKSGTPHRDNFITRKKAKDPEAPAQFDKLNTSHEVLASYFASVKSTLDGCRVAIALNHNACKFGKLTTLNDLQFSIDQHADAITRMNRVIRMVLETMTRPASGLQAGEAQTYLNDFTLMMLMPTDLMQLIAFGSKDKDFQTSLSENKLDLDEGYEYLIAGWPNQRQFEFKDLARTPGYLSIESILVGLEAEKVSN